MGQQRVRARCYAIHLSKNKALIKTGHAASEETGMAYLADWLRERIPGCQSPTFRTAARSASRDVPETVIASACVKIDNRMVR